MKAFAECCRLMKNPLLRSLFLERMMAMTAKPPPMTMTARSIGAKVVLFAAM